MPGWRRSTPGRESARSLRKNRTTSRLRSPACAASTRKHGELRQVEEKRAVLQQQAGQLSLVQARIEAAARAVPLLPLLQEAARASASATAAAKAADEARARHDSAQKDGKLKTAALKSAEKAAEAIKKIREQVSRLHQVIGRLPEREQLQAAIERQTQGLQALEMRQSSLARWSNQRRPCRQSSRPPSKRPGKTESSGYDRSWTSCSRASATGRRAGRRAAGAAESASSSPGSARRGEQAERSS